MAHPQRRSLFSVRLPLPLAFRTENSIWLYFYNNNRLRLISAHLEQLEQIVRSPDTMTLPPGIYTIQNVKYRNWAMLFDENEGEVVAGSSASTNVGEKVSVSKIWIANDNWPNLVVVHQPTGKRDLYFAESILQQQLCDVHPSRYRVK